ncbi:MAG: amidohydrolase [Synergistaceae bacterium]|nr:amidohydrolase [Synergistaceae bacterium]
MDIDKRIDGMLPMLTAFRRELHEYPDLSGEEQPNCARLAEILGRHGIEYKLMLDGTAAVASVGTSGSGKTVALRADTDALPLTDETGLPFASKKRGVMHACGHDIHTAAALGAAILLKEMEPELTGMVKIFFQPAEEGTGGAERMIAAGCLDVPHVSHVLGLHVNHAIAAGRAAFKFGKMHAASDEFTLILHGRGCHGAHTEEGCDAVAMAGQFIHHGDSEHRQPRHFAAGLRGGDGGKDRGRYKGQHHRRPCRDDGHHAFAQRGDTSPAAPPSERDRGWRRRPLRRPGGADPAPQLRRADKRRYGDGDRGRGGARGDRRGKCHY